MRIAGLALCLSIAACSGTTDAPSEPVDVPDTSAESDAATSDAATDDAAAGDAAAGDTADDTPAADATSDASTTSDGTAGDGTASDAGGLDAITPADAAPETAGPSCPAVAACPATPTNLVEGAGPRAIDRCAFVLRESTKGPAWSAAIDALAKLLPRRSVTQVLADLNRDGTNVSSSSFPGVPGFLRAFAWDTDDMTKEWWIPQGLTGSADANAAGTIGTRKAVLVTWYYDIAKHPGSTGEKGIRVSLADVTTFPPKYRHLLLVEPKIVSGRADFDPINIHAGGVAWVGDLLYVADTGGGLRVFDLTNVFETATSGDSIGWDGAAYQGGLYKYVVPQIAAWNDGSPCNPAFSFVALDRSTTPPSLVTGEYSADTIRGRILRFPLEGAGTTLLPTTYASAAHVMAHQQVQGAVTNGGRFYFSSSKPAGGDGALYVARPASTSSTHPWVDAPEDLMFDVNANVLWSLGEALSKRWVFATDATKITGP